MAFKILLPGLPFRSSRGFLGWSTVALARIDGLNVLIDAAGYNERVKLVEKIKEENLTVKEIDMVFLSHLHFDHVINFDLFPNAQVIVGKKEWDFCTGEKGKQDIFTPREITRCLQESKLKLVEDGEKLSENLTVFHTPGHTTGGISLLLEMERKYFFTGDALKNATEFVSGLPGATAEWNKTRERIRNLGADVIVTGHDRPFRPGDDGKITYEGAAEINIYAYCFPNDNTFGVFSLKLDSEGE